MSPMRRQVALSEWAMMQRTVKLFVIPAERCPGGPPDPPREFSISADTLDGLHEATRERLVADGYRVRSISFGPDGLVAYAEEQP